MEHNPSKIKKPNHAKPPRVPIAGAYPEEFQQGQPVKTIPIEVSTGSPSKNKTNQNETRPSQKTHTTTSAPYDPTRQRGTNLHWESSEEPYHTQVK